MATVSVSTSANGVTPKDSSGVHFDASYVKTIPGILKVAEGVVSLIGFICVQTIYLAAYFSAGGWYSFVSMSGFWISLLLVVFYLFHIVERFSWVPWLIFETGFAAIWSAFFFIAACVAASKGRLDPGWGAAAFFGFVAMLIFGYEAFLKYKAWRGGEPAQGEKQMSDAATGPSSNSATGPSYPTY